jgi:RNA polymerase sigma-70 factor, ECF subfamily
MPDSDIQKRLRRLLDGDQAAWREIVREHAGMLLAISRRTFAAHGFSASHHDAEDVVSEVWRNLLAQECRLVKTAIRNNSLVPLLITLARNRSIDLMRRKRLPTVSLDDQDASTSDQAGEEPPPREILSLLPDALDALAPKERVCVRLFFFQRKKYREIEALTGIPLNSIGPTLGRALVKLRRLLSHEKS